MNTKEPRKHKRTAEQKAKHKETQRAWRLANPEKYAAINERRRLKLLAGGRPSLKTLPWWKRPLNKHWLRPFAEAMRRLGWTLDELAKRMQKNAATVCHLISGYYYPSIEYQNEIQQVFASAGEYLDVLECWPQVNKEIPAECLNFDQSPELPSEEQEIVAKVLTTLPEREMFVLVNRFYRNLTLDQIGEINGVSRQCIGQIEAKALRKMRHPSRMRQLEKVAEFLFSH